MIFYMLVSHCKTSRTNNERVISTFKFIYPHLTLKDGPKVKSDHIRRFAFHDFLEVGFTLQSSNTNNKRVLSTFKFGYLRLTLKGRPKIKPDHIRRFAAHDFLLVGFTLQTSRTNNKRVISKAATILRLLGNETIQLNTRGKKSEPGLRKQLNIDVKSTTKFYFFFKYMNMISHRLVSLCKPLGPIISKL